MFHVEQPSLTLPDDCGEPGSTARRSLEPSQDWPAEPRRRTP